MYERVNAAIRAQDNETVVIFEPCVFNEGNVGFTQVCARG